MCVNKLKQLLLVAIVLLLSGCVDKQKVDATGFLSVSNQSFVDAQGRTVILNGINHVIKDPERNYLHDGDEQLFKDFRQAGFNCIRYGIIWDGLEPEPGVINEAYLKEIDKRVKWAEENNIWIILDMHQDLFSRKYSDGAPLWATLDEGLPHETGDVWSDAYLVSPAIQRVFDNFWENKPASDGIGIQDHYINVWRVIAQRYANSPAVAGFDIMNEPFMGSGAQTVFQNLLEGYAAFMATQTDKLLTEEELAEMWGNEEQRINALKTLDNKEVYSSIVDNAYEAVRTFEEGALSRFYQKTRDAIREVNKKQIIFLEHNYFCNLGVKSSFIIPTDQDGNKDVLCAYAPHGYDLVTDTKEVSTPGYNRVDVIFDRIFESAKERNMPVLVGEWGAFTQGDEYTHPCNYLVQLFEKHLAGQTYWCWWPEIEKQDYYQRVLIRPYPMAVNGTLIRYGNTIENQVFTCEWEESDSAISSQIYIPDMAQWNVRQMNLEPKSKVRTIRESGKKSGYLEIAPIGGKRTLTISAKAE